MESGALRKLPCSPPLPRPPSPSTSLSEKGGPWGFVEARLPLCLKLGLPIPRQKVPRWSAKPHILLPRAWAPPQGPPPAPPISVSDP